MTQNQMKLIEQLDTDRDYTMAFSYWIFDPEFDKQSKIKKVIKYDKVEEYALIDEQYEMIAERRSLTFTLYLLKEFYIGWEEMTRRKRSYQNIRAKITKRNKFNKIIMERNKNFKPSMKLVKQMLPIPNSIYIFPIININNRFYLNQSYKIWCMTNLIFNRQIIDKGTQILNQIKSNLCSSITLVQHSNKVKHKRH
jgi:hypothetical protein